MQIVIVGCGDVGMYLTQLLEEKKHEVVVVDKDPIVCEKVREKFKVHVVEGDATELSVLERAGARKADALVALTANDETNMVVSLLGKELGAKTAAARIERVEYDEAILKKLGIDIVIHPKAASAGYIEELITKPELLDVVFISKGLAQIVELQVKEKSKAVGKRLGELEKVPGTNVIAIVRGTELLLSRLDLIVLAKDRLVVVATREASDHVEKIVE